MDMLISGLLERSTASGWLLCCIALVGVLQLGRILAAQRPKMHELDIGERSGLREEFIAEMAALRDEVKGLREENSALRGEIRTLHGVIDGMRRENLQSALSTQRAVVGSLPPDFVPTKTREALERIEGTNE